MPDYLDVTIRISRPEEARTAARELLSRLDVEQWALWVALATESLALAEAVDQATVVWFQSVPRGQVPK